MIEGTLPIGGLSSSAAVTISFLSVLCRVNQIQLSDLEVISIAKRAENEYVGVSSGKTGSVLRGVLQKRPSSLSGYGG